LKQPNSKFEIGQIVTYESKSLLFPEDSYQATVKQVDIHNEYALIIKLDTTKEVWVPFKKIR
jgi:hypothetical protein